MFGVNNCVNTWPFRRGERFINSSFSQHVALFETAAGALVDVLLLLILPAVSLFAFLAGQVVFRQSSKAEKFLNTGFGGGMFTTADKIRFDRVFSGNADIDALLPIYTQSIYTLYGKPGAGKSNIALAYCVTAIQQGHNCVWIDTEGKFPVSRLEVVTKTRGVADWQSRLFYTRAMSVKDLINAVRMVYKGEVAGKVVVVDTIINAFRQDPEYQGLRNLAKRQQTLSAILGTLFRAVNRFNSTAFTITHSMETILGRDKHVGGHVLAHETRLLRVEVGQNSNTRSIITEKIPDMPPISIPFTICDYGICYTR